MLSADMMLFAFRQGEILKANLAGPGEPGKKADRFARDTDTYLRIVRQLDRLTQVRRQLAGAARTGAKPK